MSDYMLETKKSLAGARNNTILIFQYPWNNGWDKKGARKLLIQSLQSFL